MAWAHGIDDHHAFITNRVMYVQSSLPNDHEPSLTHVMNGIDDHHAFITNSVVILL